MMWLRLAKMAGEVEVEAVKQRITAREFEKWRAYWRLEPWGCESRLMAQLLASLINAATNGEAMVKADYFLPDADLEYTPPNQDEKLELAMGGRKVKDSASNETPSSSG